MSGGHIIADGKSDRLRMIAEYFLRDIAAELVSQGEIGPTRPIDVAVQRLALTALFNNLDGKRAADLMAYAAAELILMQDNHESARLGFAKHVLGYIRHLERESPDGV